MAQKPDGKAARTERVTFTRPAAERIAKAVRTVEGGNRDTGPLTFGNRGVGQLGKVFRVCTFTGAWSKNTSKTVTFSSTTATASVQNIFATLTATGTRNCAVAKEGGTWYLIAAEC